MAQCSQEGVCKFQLIHQTGNSVAAASLGELNAWRHIFYQLKLLGQDSHRYEGLGFGNISRRAYTDVLAEYPQAFIVSGTQTGKKAALLPSDYTLVTYCDVKTNHLYSLGPVKPSSESLSHGVLYQLDPSIGFVFHLHSPEIWNKMDVLHLHATSEHIEYGTPAMAEAIVALYRNGASEAGIIAMRGHQDGVICFGSGAEQAGTVAIRYLARALLS